MIQRNLDVEELSIKQLWTLGQPINVMLQALYIGLKLNTLRRDDIIYGNARQFRGRLHEKSKLQNDGSQSTERSSCLCFKGCPCSVLLDSWALPRGKLQDWSSLATRYSRGRYFLFIAHLGFLKKEVWKGNLSFLSHIGCYEKIVLVFGGGRACGKMWCRHVCRQNNLNPGAIMGGGRF